MDSRKRNMFLQGGKVTKTNRNSPFYRAFAKKVKRNYIGLPFSLLGVYAPSNIIEPRTDEEFQDTLVQLKKEGEILTERRKKLLNELEAKRLLQGDASPKLNQKR